LSLRQKPKTTVSLTNSLAYYSKFKNIFLSNTSENKHNSLNTFLDKHFFIKHSLSLSSNYSLKTPSKCSNKTALRRLEQSLQFLKNYKGYNYVKNSGQKNSQKKNKAFQLVPFSKTKNYTFKNKKLYFYTNNLKQLKNPTFLDKSIFTNFFKKNIHNKPKVVKNSSLWHFYIFFFKTNKHVLIKFLNNPNKYQSYSKTKTIRKLFS